MEIIEKRLLIAKRNSDEIEQLLKDYLPFIKKQLSNFTDVDIEYDDMLSIAMLTFVNCIKQYDEGKGNFLSFSSICIKNRLIDEYRKSSKYKAKIITYDNSSNDSKIYDKVSSFSKYNKDLEKENLNNEIDSLSMELSNFNIAFMELPKICPKQNKARIRCLELAKEVTSDLEMKTTFLNNHKIPQLELAKRFNISTKTIEKHRKYIVTLIILLLGDYPSIKSFLPQYKELK